MLPVNLRNCFSIHTVKRLRHNLFLLFGLTCVGLFLLNHSLKGPNPGKDELVEFNVDVVIQTLEPSPLYCEAKGASRELTQDLRSASAFALSESSILKRSSSCQNYFQNFAKVLKPRIQFQNKEKIEENLNILSSKNSNSGQSPPVRLAFSLLLHENVGIFETLLHLIFRPYHSYCIHVDSKAKRIFHEAVKSIVKCFQERFPDSKIFLADFNIPVYWGHVSMLNAELNCLKLLEQRDPDWKYYLNLAGSELPLVPMSEIEEILSRLSPNQSVIQTFPIPEKNKDRYRFSHALADRELNLQESRWYLFKKAINPFEDVNKSGAYRIVPMLTENPKLPPPFNLTIYKGQKNVILSRPFSTFVLHHPVAKGFRQWCDDMLIPDESFYSTLFHIKVKNVEKLRFKKKQKNNAHLFDDLESSYLVEQDAEVRTHDIVGGHCIRRSLWDYEGCKGQLKREICNLSVDDLPLAVNHPCQKPTVWIPCLFVNKLDLEVDPLSVVCLAQHVLAGGAQGRQKESC